MLALPEEEGINLAAYLVPIALVLAMIAGGGVRAAAVADGGPPRRAAARARRRQASDAELKRLDEDLARYE